MNGMQLMLVIRALAIATADATEAAYNAEGADANCNFKTVDATALSDDDLNGLIASSEEPLLLRGVSSRWPASHGCHSIDACVEAHGDMQLGIATGAMIGAMNPESALSRTWMKDKETGAVKPANRAGGERTSLEMSMRDYYAAVQSASLPHDAYSFFDVRGTTFAAAFPLLRALFASALAIQHPELLSLPSLSEMAFSTRIAFGGRASGNGWHGHGPTLLAVVEGRKNWVVRPSESVPKWLQQTIEQGGSTLAWLQRANAAAETNPSWQWSEHLWFCVQEPGELVYLPDMLKHAIFNEGPTLALAMQVDLPTSTPLHSAALEGREEHVQLLLNAGANASATDLLGGTPLHGAAAAGHAGVVKVLCDQAADPNAIKHSDGTTPLIIAASRNHAGVVRELVSQLSRSRHTAAAVDTMSVADASAAAGKHGTALHFAALYGAEAAASVLLELGAKVELLNAKGSTPLHLAVSQGRAGVAKLLLGLTGTRSATGSRSQLNAADYATGAAPLHLAGYRGDEACAQLLLKAGASTHTLDAHGRTPLQAAKFKGHATVAKLIEDAIKISPEHHDAQAAMDAHLPRGNQATPKATAAHDEL